MKANYKRIPGLIIGRTTGPLTGNPPRGDPLQIKYSAIGFIDLISGERVREEVVDEYPTRRISVGAKVVPADVGDPCDITYVNGVRHFYVFEAVPFKEACP